MLCNRVKPELGGGAASLLGGATSSFLIEEKESLQIDPDGWVDCVCE